MENIQPISQLPQPSSKNPYKILFFVTLCLFLITTGLLVFIWFASFSAFTQLKSTTIENIVEDKSAETEVISEITPTTTPTIPTPSATTSSIYKDWKTYNTKIKISVDAPSSYSFEDAYSEKGGVTLLSYDPNSNKYVARGGFPVNEAKIYISFSDQKTIDDFIKNLTSEPEDTTKILSQKNLTILNYQSKLVKFTGSIEGLSESMAYIINKNNTVFVASILLNRNTAQSTKDKFYSDFTKIVNTIKFN